MFDMATKILIFYDNCFRSVLIVHFHDFKCLSYAIKSRMIARFQVLKCKIIRKTRILNSIAINYALNCTFNHQNTDEKFDWISKSLKICAINKRICIGQRNGILLKCLKIFIRDVVCCHLNFGSMQMLYLKFFVK